MSLVGSNPTLSGEYGTLPHCGEVLEWSNRRAWRARRPKGLVGSNPTLSASFCIWMLT